MEIIKVFKECNALLEGHFILSSGLHSNKYLQCAKVLQYPDIASIIGEEIAENFATTQVDLIVGPAMGGIIIAQEVGRALSTRTIFSERENGKMTFRRGFEVNQGEKAIVVEDVITTGGSAKEVVEMLNELGVEVIAVASIIDRSNGSADFGVPFHSLAKIEVETYNTEECPLCIEGDKAVKPGSRGLK